MRKRSLGAIVALGAAMALAPPAVAQHPNPQPRPGPSTQTVSPDGTTTFVTTPEGPLPVGQNQLDYVESNIFDRNGVEMLNTLPSRPDASFNLHAGPVITEEIDRTSPTEDLEEALDRIRDAAEDGRVDREAIELGLDILEGEPVPGRAYSGFPLLHYTGPEKVKRVEPIFDEQGRKVGGNVDIHQIWYDEKVESDTAFLDPSAVQDVPWTVTYTIDVLKGGADDFAPFVMYFDAPPSDTPGSFGPPHVAMDASFFPMSEGTRHVIRIRHAPARYYNLTYTWGWRVHPPRVQVTENALKTAGGKTLPQWEIDTFGPAPRSSEEAKLAAIAKIGELSPAKRMWQALRDARDAAPEEVVALMDEALAAFEDWTDRTSLPRGVEADPSADVTLFYVNNTIYGNARTFDAWDERGAVFEAALLNGDHFTHGYMNVDFGGSRGWENQFQDAGGPAASHTFGRVHWWVNAGGPWGAITVPPVSDDGVPGSHRVEIELNFDSPERLSLYNFDPLHHDVAVYSLH